MSRKPMSGRGYVSYGGQAVIEGVVMRGASHAVLSVRAPGGDIVSVVKQAPSWMTRGGFWRWPVIRGALSLWDSLSLGIGMLIKSAELAFPEEGKPSSALTYAATALGVILAMAIFMVAPAIAAQALARALGIHGRIAQSAIETLFRIAALFAYVALVSRTRDIQRVLQYHGAEHKVIWALEKNREAAMDLIAGFHRVPDAIRAAQPGLSSQESLSPERPLSSEGSLPSGGLLSYEGSLSAGDSCCAALTSFLVEKARGQPRQHPRCGTSFLAIAAVCTWLVFVFISPQQVFMRAASRLVLLPLVFGVSYEVLKLSVGKDSFFWRVIRAPGVALQSLTTREPDLDQIQVAAESLARLIEIERGVSPADGCGN